MMHKYSNPEIEVADIFNEYGVTYRANHKLPLQSLKTMSAIENCRTSVLGGHVDKCDNCGHERNSYNSCRNRHCPKCQGLAQIKWLEKRKQELLPVKYFHLVFTIPSELNRLTLVNQKLMYGILFKAASETILMLAGQKKHLGAKPGIISILHTWGQNLMEHPHIHMLVTRGGLSLDGKRWINSKKKFFISVKVLSQVFRGKFLYYLKKAYTNNELMFKGEIEKLKTQELFKQLLTKLYKKQWVVYAKKPFGNAEKVLSYLGRYTHRIAISNHRIKKVENNKVSFQWKDYADNNKKKIMTVSAQEFIRRFLLHVLPSGFFKIRYYGLLSSRNKKSNISLSRKLLGVVNRIIDNIKQSWQDMLLKHTGFDIRLCPRCKKGQMKLIKTLELASHL